MQQKVEAALKLIRPVLEKDGGNIELVECAPDGVVRVRLQGHCKGCPHSQATLKSIVEKTIVKLAPGVRKVEAVD
ncbi:MAG: NifU family protein [Desulfovibrionaceae bacterium]|nr:NifU family protein [Desulfovibrionaceae bacterium]